MADMMNQMCSSVMGNSFIANVNLLASQFHNLQSILNVPNQTKEIQDTCSAIRDQVARMMDNVDRSKHEVIDAMHKSFNLTKENGVIRDKTVEVHRQCHEILDRNKQTLMFIGKKIAEFEADMIIANGVANCEVLYKAVHGIGKGDVINIPNFRYTVGRNTLRLSWDGMALYRCVHYEEIGCENEMSSSVRFIVDIPKGAVVNFFNISSSMAEMAYNKAKQLKFELEEARRMIERDLQASIRNYGHMVNTMRMVEFYYKKTRELVVDYLSNSYPIVVLEDEDHEQIPDIDCIFLYAKKKKDDLPEIDFPEEPDIANKPVCSICGHHGGRNGY